MPGPPSARFVRNLEDVLDLYAQPKDPDRPLVCFDETSKALHEHFRPPTPPRPGQPARYDYQYDRMGTCNLFLCSRRFPEQAQVAAEVAAWCRYRQCAGPTRQMAMHHRRRTHQAATPVPFILVTHKH